MLGVDRVCADAVVRWRDEESKGRGGVFGDGTLHLFSPLSKNEGKDDFCSCMGWREKKQQRAAHG